MSRIDRRRFLTGAAAATALAFLPGRTWAAPWGRAPISAADSLPANPARRVLEIFLYGGLSPWESFYTVPEYGRPDDPEYPNQQWHLFPNDHDRVFRDKCGIDPDKYLQRFGRDSAGVQVFLGPSAEPFRRRDDLLDRLRIVVMRHSLEPHEAAIPLALSGMRLGNPRMTGMGAHVQRYFIENAELGGPRTEPYSYVLQPSNIISTDNTRAAESVGVHPGAARPLGFKIGRADITDRLQREHIDAAYRDAFDALVAHHTQTVESRYAVDGNPLRSPRLADHAHALSTLADAEALSGVLGDDFLAKIGGEACDTSRGTSQTATGVKAAVELLTHPTTPARYVNVVDGGLAMADGGGGYDTHFLHLHPQARNTWHVLEVLAEAINAPGENDPRKLDLDDTLIILTSDFGRTPFRQDGGSGTNHHPYGYVQLLLGGPVKSGITGAIGPDGTATEWVTPSEFRIATLGAMGIYPFQHESFAVGDVRDAGSELGGLRSTQQRVLGRQL